MRRAKCALLLLCLGATTMSPVASRAVEAVPLVGSLHAGDAAFWSGGAVDGALAHSVKGVPSNANVDRCATTGSCFTFGLELLDTGADVRIALDTPYRDDGFEISVFAPGGALAKKFSNNNAFTTEAFITAPAPGLWTIKVAPVSADYASFRMRAKLEAAPYAPVADADGLLLPDMRVTRLWEFGFVAPANPANGAFPPDYVNPPLDVLGEHPLSCGLDEMQQDGVSRCLRFSFGLANVGEGYFDVRFPSDNSGALHQNYQCVQRADGATPLKHTAGFSYYHTNHEHYHFKDIIAHQLMKVTDRATGAMVPAGKGEKLGYSPADQGIPEWRTFGAAPSGTSGTGGNCDPADTQRLGLSRGWGDAYRYQRPGNYVDFNTNSDGYYVVQTTVDPTHTLIEARTDNNTSYAYLHIVGDHVDELESGVGKSPWDPARVVFDENT
jgi:hypothetical protein